MKHLTRYNEFLSTTIDIDMTIDMLTKRFKLKFLHAYEYNDSIDIEYFTIDYLDEINEFMSSMGWYPSFIREIGIYTKKLALNTLESDMDLIIRYEKKYDDIVGVPDFIYHVTPDIYLDKIKKYGLVAKSHNKKSTHPSRIYLFTTDDSTDAFRISDMLYDELPSAIRERVRNYYLLKIKTSDLDIKFYKDPNFPKSGGGVWTYDNIPPENIEVLEEIEM